MGQGYSLTSLTAGSANIEVPELSDLAHEKSLGAARFMKSIRARHRQGRILVKAFVKPYPSFDLQRYVRYIAQEREALEDIPNTLAYQRVFETANGGFLARQFVHSSLYDRLSTRPFLEDVEKKWITFQLLSALRDCHAREVYHGDIKTENLLVTSWNWLYLTDFSTSSKPAYLPEDNPADFTFFFDTSGRRTCYLAPERFVASGGNQVQGTVNWAMDIFSAGCAIAEIFLEGPIFTLSQLFRYRKGDLQIEHTRLQEVHDREVQELIMHMITLQPESRYTADEILKFWRGKVFPEYFFGFLHQYMAMLTNFPSAKQAVILESNLGEPDERIARIHSDFDKISFFLGYMEHNDRPQKATLQNLLEPTNVPCRNPDHERYEGSELQKGFDRGTLIFLGVVVSSLRNTTTASARLKACDLLFTFGRNLPDEIKLDRILPYIVVLLSDDSDLVKVAALKTMTYLLASVHVISPVNAYMFPEYIFPRLRGFLRQAGEQASPIVRATYAACLGSLARTAARVLDMAQAIKVAGNLVDVLEYDWASETAFQGLFDVSRLDLVSHFEEATKSLITDPDSSVRRAFLGSVSALCIFFGSSKASDVILSHLNTYLNEQDWILKCAFVEIMVGLATFVGVVNLEKFMLPMMIQSLTDKETFVVERVIRSFASMAELGLLQQPTVWDVMTILVRFLVHPSIWIREAAAQFVAACSQQLSPADAFCVARPLMQPFLRNPLLEPSQHLILDALKPPLSRSVLDMATLWATKVENGIFWEDAARDSVFLLPEPASANRALPSDRPFPTRILASQCNEEDHQWVAKLRGLGMKTDDEVKLLALRDYIWRLAHRNKEPADGFLHGRLNNIVSLNQINVTPQNVFFDNKVPLRAMDNASSQRRKYSASTPDTPSDLLTHIDDHPRAQKSLTRDLVRGETSPGATSHRSQTQRRNLSPSSVPRSQPSGIPRVSPAGVPLKEPENSQARSPTSLPAATSRQDMERKLTSKNNAPEHKPSNHLLQHRPSAIKLLNGNDVSKAGAETSTTSETAFGKLDATEPPSPSIKPAVLSGLQTIAPAPGSTSLSQASQTRYELNHSYSGDNENILRLLDNHFAENYPTDLFQLGVPRQALDPRSRIPRHTKSAFKPARGHPAANSASDLAPWFPSGHLLVMFSEHTAMVTAVVAAPDHAFFVTASDDGTCKIWDTTRLEKNVAPRSRQTYRQSSGAGFTALCFIENTHAFAGATRDGSVLVIKVDCKKTETGTSSRYGKLSIAGHYHISSVTNDATQQDKADAQQPFEYAVSMLQYRSTSSQSVLLLLTSKSRVLAVDLRTMETMYTLVNSLSHGSTTAFAIDKKHNWLLLGTSHGILDLWDLRFQLHLRSWAFQNGNRIDKICLHPTKGKGKWVMVVAGVEITVWDLEKHLCREVYRPLADEQFAPRPSSGRPTETSGMNAYAPWFPNEDGKSKLYQRFLQKAQQTDRSLASKLKGTAEKSGSDVNMTKGFSRAARMALYTGYDNIANGSNPQELIKAPFMISGGPDLRLRFWDLTRPEHSFVVSGSQTILHDESPTGRTRYEVSHPGGQIMLVQEISSSSDVSTPEGPGSPVRGGMNGAAGSRSMKDNQAAKQGPSTTSTSKSKAPRSSLISKHQQALLRNHFDSITDCCVLARPYGMVVSVDSGGGVYVFR